MKLTEGCCLHLNRMMLAFAELIVAAAAAAEEEEELEEEVEEEVQEPLLH